MTFFVGRTKELARLEDIWNNDSKKYCAVLGRRRVGKSTLLAKFAEGKRTLFFQFTNENPYSNFSIMAIEVAKITKRSIEISDDLVSTLHNIAEVCREEKTLLIFDEFPYLCDSIKGASGVMQWFVDRELAGTETMVIVCGSSVSAMRELTENYHSPLYDRFRNVIEVEPLTPAECASFHQGMDAADQLRLYMIMGGMPEYHREMLEKTYRECIMDCFVKSRRLSEEGIVIINSELKPSSLYIAMATCISDGTTKQSEIADKLHIDRSDCSKHLKKMEDLKIIDHHVPKIGAPKNPVYYIRDPMVDFYFRVFRFISTDILRPISDEEKFRIIQERLDSHFGTRFEILCREWTSRNMRVKGDVGRWWGRVPGKISDTDIDIVANLYDSDLKTDTLLGECKFKNEKIGVGTMNELRHKATQLDIVDNVRFAIFSGSGFTYELTEESTERNDLELIGPDMLLTEIEKA